MATKIGEYSVQSGGAAVSFWPLNPGTTVAQATPPAPVAPVNPNLIVPPPTFVIFDVVIRFTDEPVETAIADPALLAHVSGAAPNNSMPLTKEADGSAHICFAVPCGAANFEGRLRLSADRTNPNKNIAIQLPIKAAVNTRTEDLFVFFVVHDFGLPNPPPYGWVKVLMRQRAGAAAPIAGADVQAKILRENHTFKAINRTVSFRTGNDGYAAQGARSAIGLPINWPIIFSASANGYVPRGHMIRLAAANVHDNLAPFETGVVMLTRAQASLAGKKILLDPGHGVVYNYPANRRSQEWYVASRVADRITAFLSADHQVPPANVIRTRTAGFGLIEPAQIGAVGAPETGAQKFEYDMPTKRVRIKQGALGLKDLSDLVLTAHADPNDAAQPVAPADRERLLALNAATLVSIIARLNVSHAPNRRVRPGSIRWDGARSDYLYTHDPVATPNVGGVDAHLPITTDDWFTIDDPMLQLLIDRSVRWSLAQEIGSGPPAAGGRPAFVPAARAAMVAAGARDYMKNQVWREVNVKPPHPYLNHGSQGWSPTDRNNFFNGTPCDLYLSIHENAIHPNPLTAIGSENIVSMDANAPEAPPDDQIRLGKIFIKYVDPFDQGLRQEGVTQESSHVAMLHTGNTVRDKYTYFELEFMDVPDPANANVYRYEQMVDPAFIDRVARQIVNGIVEALLEPQIGFDSVKLRNVYTLW